MNSLARTKRLAYSAALAAVVFSLAMVAAKAWAWAVTDSAAMLGSMADSTVDAVVSITNFLALRYAFRPADDNHRHGHGKAEGVAALMQSAFIGGAAVFVALESIRQFTHPAPVMAVQTGIIVLGAATLGTLLLTRYQLYVARRTNSLAVEADGTHYVSDVVMNAGIIISLLVVGKTGWLWFDPMVGILVAAWLLWQARSIAAKALSMLLDREIEDETRDTVRTIITTANGIESMHDLRMTRSGTQLMVSFDVEVDPELTVAASHDIVRDIERAIITATKKDYTRTEVMIHVDPLGDITDSRHKKLEDYHAR